MGEEPAEKKSEVAQERAPLRTYEEYRNLLLRYLHEKDPQTILPDTELKITNEGERFINALIRCKDEPWTGGGMVDIGTANLTLEEDNTALLKYITLFDKWRDDERKYGYAAYLALIGHLAKHGIRLVAGHSLSRASHAIWKGLVSAGIARMVGPEIVNETATYSNYSTTKFEVV